MKLAELPEVVCATISSFVAHEFDEEALETDLLKLNRWVLALVRDWGCHLEYNFKSRFQEFWIGIIVRSPDELRMVSTTFRNAIDN